MTDDVHWYRSWPDQVPAGRAHVVDSLPRLVMRDCNYATLDEFQPWPSHEPGWFMLEWDIALGQQERTRFAHNALETSDRVRVAPYPIYPKDGRGPTQVHRNRGVPIADGVPTAEAFGLGCVYFPQKMLNALWDDPPKRLIRSGELTDTVLSDWYRSHGRAAVVDWSVTPQHLHGD